MKKLKLLISFCVVLTSSISVNATELFTVNPEKESTFFKALKQKNEDLQQTIESTFSPFILKKDSTQEIEQQELSSLKTNIFQIRKKLNKKLKEKGKNEIELWNASSTESIYKLMTEGFKKLSGVENLLSEFNQVISKSNQWVKESLEKHCLYYQKSPTPVHLWYAFITRRVLGIRISLTEAQNNLLGGTFGFFENFKFTEENADRQLIWKTMKETSFITSKVKIEDPIKFKYEAAEIFPNLVKKNPFVIIGCGLFDKERTNFLQKLNFYEKAAMNCGSCLEKHDNKVVTINLDPIQMPHVIGDALKKDLWERVLDNSLNSIIDETGHSIFIIKKEEIFQSSYDLETNFSNFKIEESTQNFEFSPTLEIIFSKLKLGGCFETISPLYESNESKKLMNFLKEKIGFSKVDELEESQRLFRFTK